ncbi:MAG: PilZ domain-containing protein [Bdellovibrionaceae bacterium]|nr:PilZ domain-containing protein [Pseudobdellovibrionaceae bacterium]
MTNAREASPFQLEVVNFEKDRQKIFETMRSRTLLISALAKDKTHFAFEFEKIERSCLYLRLTVPASRAFVPYETLTLTFGLEEGQYFLKGAIEPVSGDLYAIPIGEALYRMQRRNNFRAPVPENMTITFEVPVPNGKPHAFAVADLSGGGLGLLVRAEDVPGWRKGDRVRGRLLAPGKPPIELEVVMKYLGGAGADGRFKVGVQCQGLDTESENTLIAICMQIHRELFSMFREFNR